MIREKLERIYETVNKEKTGTSEVCMFLSREYGYCFRVYFKNGWRQTHDLIRQEKLNLIRMVWQKEHPKEHEGHGYFIIGIDLKQLIAEIDSNLSLNPLERIEQKLNLLIESVDMMLSAIDIEQVFGNLRV